MYAEPRHAQHLAWHETLELHETVAFTANHLMAFKMNIAHVKNPELKQLYAETIQSLENNLKELTVFYPQAPVGELRSSAQGDMTAFYAGQLLGFAKTAVRNYAVAITETATPSLRDVFQKQLNAAIQCHAKAFQFMLKHGYYPAYDLKTLLGNDQKMAAEALNR